MPPEPALHGSSLDFSKRRSRIERAAVRGLIAALLLATVVEAIARHGYEASLAALEGRIQADPKTGRANKNVKSAEACALVSGWPARRMQYREPGRAINYRWHSLFSDLRIRLQISPDDVVLALTTGETARQEEQDAAARLGNAPPSKSAQPWVPRTERFPQGSAEEMPRGVALDLNRWAISAASTVNGNLIRELIRQGLLIAARDGLRLRTRDRCLGEPLPDAAGAVTPPLDVTITFDTAQDVTVVVFREKAGGSERLAEFLIQLPASSNDLLEQLTRKAEDLSAHQFVEILKSAGYSGSENSYLPQSNVAPQILADLARFDPLSQFSAIRALHAEVKKSGESPERLAALARGYALLGSLAENWWSPAHKAYKARAMLYAERLCRKGGQTATGFCTRAYVRALVGLHGAALADLDAAKTARGAEAIPEWAAEIAAFCRFDAKKLAAMADAQPPDPLPAYLQMLAIAYSDEPTLRFLAANAMLEREPACSRAVEAILHAGAQLEVLHHASDIGVVRFTAALRRAIPLIADVPAEIGKAEGKLSDGDLASVMQGRANLVAALRTAGRMEQDAGEPSLAALAQLVQEISFLNSWHLLQYWQFAMGLPVESRATLEAVRPVVQGHPYELFIEALGLDSAAATKSLQKLSQSFALPQLDPNQLPMMDIFRNYQVAANGAQEDMLRQGDRVFMDLVLTLQSAAPISVTSAATARLAQVSPHSSLTAAAAIKYDWKRVYPRARDWERKYHDDLIVLRALSDRYTQMRLYDDAERCLKQQLELVQDQTSYQALAAIYLARGDEPQRIETLKASLKAPCFGLEHAVTHAELARHFMRLKDWGAARPHATQAAESYSEWGLSCAADFHELTGDWKSAEQFQRLRSERYAGAAHVWYHWCRRTNHGDVEQARRQAQPILEFYRESPDAIGRYRAAALYLLDDRRDDALTMYQEASRIAPSAFYDLCAAVQADALGQAELRDDLLKQALAHGVKEQNYLVELIHVVRNIIANGAASRVDQKSLDWLIRQGDIRERSVTAQCYFVGMFLAHHGHAEVARTYLQRAATSSRLDSAECDLAACELRNRGENVGEQRAFEVADEDQRCHELVKLATRAFDNGQVEQAFANLAKAIAADPEFADAWCARAKLYQARGDFDNALADYSHALDALPENPILLCQRARIHEILQRDADAIRDDEAALKADPRSVVAHANLAMLYGASMNRDFRNGKNAVLHATAASQAGELTDQAAAALLAVAHAEAGDFDAAIRCQTQASTDLPMELIFSFNDRLTRFRRHEPYRRVIGWWNQREF